MKDDDRDRVPMTLILTDPERLGLTAWIREHGQIRVADATGVNPATLARALAGLEIRRGSAGLIRTALDARDKRARLGAL